MREELEKCICLNGLMSYMIWDICLYEKYLLFFLVTEYEVTLVI